MSWDGMMGISMTLGLLLGIALLALLVLGIVWLAHQLRSSPASTRPSLSDGRAPRELEMRYARGEIDRDSYLAIRDDLGRR